MAQVRMPGLQIISSNNKKGTNYAAALKFAQNIPFINTLA